MNDVINKRDKRYTFENSENDEMIRMMKLMKIEGIPYSDLIEVMRYPGRSKATVYGI